MGGPPYRPTAVMILADTNVLSTFARVDALALLWELFPEFPPYRGAVEDPPPHMSLTLDGGHDPGTLRARVEERLAGLLPAHFDVDEAVLMEESEPDVFRVRERFSFGSQR